MDKFTRDKESFRFAFGGMKVNAAPDALAPNKYPVAINVRGYTDDSIRPRPGLTQMFDVGVGYATDMRAYAELLTDNLPRILARNQNEGIYLDNSTLVGTLAGGGSLGASMIPFRPNASPDPWMYIANGADYQKFSAPVANVVSARKVGIAEPQDAPTTILLPRAHPDELNPTYIPAGAAGAVVGTPRVTDTVGAVVLNPLFGGVSCEVGPGVSYQKLMHLTAGGVSNLVLDVFPPIATLIPITSLFYFSGTTGRCVLTIGVLVNTTQGAENTSIYDPILTVALRRGALVKIDAEVCAILSSTTGPDGIICIELITTANHSTASALTVLPAIQLDTSASVATGIALSASGFQSSVTAGVGTVSTASVSPNPFLSTTSGLVAQVDDYITMGFRVSILANLIEFKIMLDVSDGTFTKDYYYYTVRASDLSQAIANTNTQIAAAQILRQRAAIDRDENIAANNQGRTYSGAQTNPGDNVWTQITFPISALTRVGSDSSKSLINFTAFRVSWNVSGTLTASWSRFFCIFGGFQPDVGDVGAPYRYRVRPRSSITGVVGNPSPATRYGLSPRRARVSVLFPSATYDPQIDTWDVFRYGGSVTLWRYIGSALTSAGGFVDNYSDAFAQGGSALDFDNFEPWPSVDAPNNGTITSIAGTTAIVDSPSANIARYLPGTLVQINAQNVYVLWARPISLGGNAYLLQFVESAGALSGIPYSILEPLLARQFLPYMWGPDAEGTVFACGDPLHPGTLYFSKNYTLDSAPDRYNIEVTPPTEPLLGGEIIDGLPFVGSTERWWRLYPQGTAYLNPQNRVQRYTPVLQPIPRGLAAPFGHCNDGTSLYWWAKDGIWSTAAGSLTDDDLYSLFPHEGVLGQDYTYGGHTIKAPAYQLANAFRLTHSNGFLYAIYQDSSGNYHMLTLDIKRKAWSYDQYEQQPACAYHVEQQAQSFAIANPVLLFGQRPPNPAFQAGFICKQTDLTNDNGITFPCVLATREYDGGDIRSGEQWGDIYLDSTPAAKGSALTLTPMFLGQAATALQTTTQGAVRIQQPVSVGGELTTNFLGCLLQWTDDFLQQAVPTTLFAWQPSFLPQPEITADRISNWDDGGSPGAKWVQGFVLQADTFNAAKGLSIQDADTLAVHTFTPAVVHNGQSEHAYSFDTPFIAHMMRVKPTDALPWRFWDIKWIAEPTPETALTWKTQPSTHGLKGYMHVRQVSITYASSQPVTLTIVVFDGTSPAVITLPSTGGAVKKIVVPLTFNKGQLYTYNFTSAATFQVYQERSEVLVGEWGRNDGYISRPLVGGTGGDEAKV